MILAIIGGYIIGTFAAFYLSRWLLDVIAGRIASNEFQSRWIRMVGAIFGALALAPAIFLAVLAGGIVGRDYLVVILGIAAITIVTVTATAVFGAGMGFLLSRGLAAGQR